MKYSIYLFLIGFVLFWGACSQSEKRKPAHLRIVSMIPNAETTVTIQSKKNSAQKYTHPLNADISSNYNTYQPGYYLVSVRTKNQIIYERTYVLGKDAFYTFVITGLIPQYPETKSDSWNYKVTHIFAGSEARVANNYLPVGFLLYDGYHGNMKEAMIRVTNTAPNAPKITVKAGKKPIAKKLKYPKTGSLHYFQPGAKTIHVYYGSVELAQKKIHPKAGYVYSIFVGNGTKDKTRLLLKIVKNPSVALLKSTTKKNQK